VARTDETRVDGRRRRVGVLAGALAALLVTGLALVALRMDSIRLRYGLADAVNQERSLRERHDELTAEVRRLRDPRELQRRAADLGFVPPARVIELPPVGRGRAPW
jgi:hypothetical protein